MQMENLNHRIAALIERGHKFSFEPYYDFGIILLWMKEAFSVLATLPEDQARFAKYSLHYNGHARDRVILGIDVLYNALINSMLESEEPLTAVNLSGSIRIESLCHVVP